MKGTEMQHSKDQFTGWHKSLRSGSGENCVFQGVQQDDAGQVAAVGVYDSKQDAVGGPVIAFRPDSWTAFVGSLTA
jgi:hypothetical protein